MSKKIFLPIRIGFDIDTLQAAARKLNLPPMEDQELIDSLANTEPQELDMEFWLDGDEHKYSVESAANYMAIIYARLHVKASNVTNQVNAVPAEGSEG